MLLTDPMRPILTLDACLQVVAVVEVDDVSGPRQGQPIAAGLGVADKEA